MEHSMKLLEKPFNNIIAGKKKIEIRLYDEKRKELNIGDIIVFSKLPNFDEKLKVKVVALLRYGSFKDLILDLGMKNFGYNDDYLIEDFVESIYSIYSKEDENNCGVLGIKIEVLGNV